MSTKLNSVCITLSVVFSALAILAGLAVPAPGQVPFACDGQAFVTQDPRLEAPVDPDVILPVGRKDNYLYVVDTSAWPSAIGFDAVKRLESPAGTPIVVNPVGFRSTDGLLYGWRRGPRPREMVRIDATGTVFSLGRPEGLPENEAFVAGDVKPDGTEMYFVCVGTITNDVPLRLYKVPLSDTGPGAARYVDIILGEGSEDPSIEDPGDNVADWAVSPFDGLLYGADREGDLTILDPVTGERVDRSVPDLPIGKGYGAVWFNAAGRLFLYWNEGEILEIDVTVPRIEERLEQPGSGRNDGAACVPGGPVLFQVPKPAVPLTFGDDPTPLVYDVASSDGTPHRDGRSDLLVVTDNGTTGLVHLFPALPQGGVDPVAVASPSFSMAAQGPPQERPWGVAIADFDADGYADIAALETGVASQSVIWGTCEDLWSDLRDASSSPCPTAVDAVTGDLNADFRSELIVGDPGVSSVCIHEGQPEPALPSVDPPLIHTVSASPVRRHVGVGDCDLDGDEDLLVEADGDITVFLNEGDLTALVPGQSFTADPIGRPLPLTVGDFNGDGRADILTGTLTSGGLAAALATGDCEFNSVPLFDTLFDSETFVITEDMNRDGNIDAILARRGEEIRLFYGDGNGVLTDGVPIPGTAVTGGMATIHWNDDDLPDIVYGSENTVQIVETIAGALPFTIDVTAQSSQFPGCPDATPNDGSDDDSVAIQCALDQAQSIQGRVRIRIPDGVYHIENHMRVPSNVIISGDAPACRFCDHPSGTPAKIEVDANDPANKIVSGLVLHGVSNVTIENLDFVMMKSGDVECGDFLGCSSHSSIPVPPPTVCVPACGGGVGDDTAGGVELLKGTGIGIVISESRDVEISQIRVVDGYVGVYLNDQDQTICSDPGNPNCRSADTIGLHFDALPDVPSELNVPACGPSSRPNVRITVQDSHFLGSGPNNQLERMRVAGIGVLNAQESLFAANTVRDVGRRIDLDGDEIIDKFNGDGIKGGCGPVVSNVFLGNYLIDNGRDGLDMVIQQDGDEENPIQIQGPIVNNVMRGNVFADNSLEGVELKQSAATDIEGDNNPEANPFTEGGNILAGNVFKNNGGFGLAITRNQVYGHIYEGAEIGCAGTQIRDNVICGNATGTFNDSISGNPVIPRGILVNGSRHTDVIGNWIGLSESEDGESRHEISIQGSPRYVRILRNFVDADPSDVFQVPRVDPTTCHPTDEDGNAVWPCQPFPGGHPDNRDPGPYSIVYDCCDANTVEVAYSGPDDNVNPTATARIQLLNDIRGELPWHDQDSDGDGCDNFSEALQGYDPYDSSQQPFPFCADAGSCGEGGPPL